MADKYVLKKLSDIDGSNDMSLPVKYHDNGDGTYSELTIHGAQITVGAFAIDQTTPGTTDSVTVKASAGIGSLTETAPATDTASSGLNGRLQRIAQRLTSLIALLPTALANGRLDVQAFENSLIALSGGQSQAVSISGTSAQSAAITAGFATVTPNVDCFFRADSNPTALSDGTDQILLSGNTYRITGITSGYKLAFKTAGATGTVYITPGA